MFCDVETAFLRRMRAGGKETVRGIYPAVRDHEWKTVPIKVTVREQRIDPSSFHLTYDAVAADGPTDFRWEGIIAGEESGVVRYEMRGRAHTSFRRNRIGFCVLHPVDRFAGASCIVEHDDGSIEEVDIPDAVSPYQPVFDIRSLTYELGGDVRVEIGFEGDVFEMEDQRNWSDASFKTYCTPLERPWPVQLHAGDTVEQAVTVRVVTEAPSTAPGLYASSGAVTLRVDQEPSGRAPAIGAYFSGPQEAVSLPLDHLRVDVDTSDAGLSAKLHSAAAAARRLNTSLFLSAMIDRDAEGLAKVAPSLDAPISRWLILRSDGLATSEQAVRSARATLGDRTPIGGGSNAYFTQVNRLHPPADLIDFVCFSVNPQVHAFDELSIMETLPMHAALVGAARRIARGRPVAVSPITLRPRYNPEAVDSTKFDPGTGHDPRQDDAFGAAWLAGSFIYLCRARAELATYFDISTICEPAAGLLRRMLTWKGLPVHTMHSSDPERVLALSVGSAPTFLLVVNLTPFEQRAMTVEGLRVQLSPYGYKIIEDA